MSTAVAAPTIGDLSFSVTDVTGLRRMRFEGVDGHRTAEDVARSVASAMDLPTDVPWSLRDERRARMLDQEGPLGRQVDREAELVVIPKSHLGAPERPPRAIGGDRPRPESRLRAAPFLAAEDAAWAVPSESRLERERRAVVMESNTPMRPILDEEGEQLGLELVDPARPDNPVLARVALSECHGDIQAIRDDAWWSGVRRGRLEPDLGLYRLRVRPGQRKGRLVDGISIELADDRAVFHRHYPVTVMTNLARRTILELRETQSAALGDTFRFYLTTWPAAASAAASAAALRGTARSERLEFSSASLPRFLAASRVVSGPSPAADESPPGPMPIFVAPDAWRDGRQLAHAGGAKESAALFCGRLFRDCRSTEVFACLEACLEARHALQEEQSVTFTGDTWSHLRQLLELRRRPRRPREMMLASVHRHPWLPGVDERGDRTCPTCATRATCARTTAVASADDVRFHRAVFAGQPWAALVVWGYTAREEEDFCVYGLQDGVFAPRSIRVLTRDLATLVP